MSFKAFLQMSCQLVDSTYAKVSINDRDIEIYTSSHVWQLSAKVFPKGPIPTALMGLLTQSCITKADRYGARFKYSPADNSISVIVKSQPLGSFLDFRKEIGLFLKCVDEWQCIILTLENQVALKAL